MRKEQRILLALGAFILCANLSQQSNEAPTQKPAINYKGILVDSSSQTYHVENITISGNTRFEVYEKPINTTHL